MVTRGSGSANNTKKAKVTDTFGLYSDAAVLARQQMLFAPRLRELNPFPVRAPECPTERATYILRQMSPDLDTIYNRYPIIPADKYSFNTDLDKWERSEKKGKYFSKHDSVITAQTSAQIEALQEYPIDKPVIIEGREPRTDCRTTRTASRSKVIRRFSLIYLTNSDFFLWPRDTSFD